MGLLFHIADILSGRRSHWNRTCVPALMESHHRSQHLGAPMGNVVQLLLAASWTMFRADFSQGPFRKWQKSLDQEGAQHLLNLYLASLVQVVSIQRGWSRLGVSEGDVWDTLEGMFPESGHLEGELVSSKDPQVVAKELERFHLKLLSIVAKDAVVQLASDPQFFRLRYYHPRLFADCARRLTDQNPRA